MEKQLDRGHTRNRKYTLTLSYNLGKKEKRRSWDIKHKDKILGTSKKWNYKTLFLVFAAG